MATLTPQILLAAYRQGIFPMDEDGEIYWYDPDPRALLPLDEKFHIPRSLRRVLQNNPFEIKFDTAFSTVMRACAAPAPKRERTWISEEFVHVYTQLQQLGYAHSVEAWQNGNLVGGLYGVHLGGLFAGESMFSLVPNASKVALVKLTEHLRARGFVLHDTQFVTPHLKTFGAFEIPREDYQRRLKWALSVKSKW